MFLIYCIMTICVYFLFVLDLIEAWGSLRLLKKVFYGVFFILFTCILFFTITELYQSLILTL